MKKKQFLLTLSLITFSLLTTSSCSLIFNIGPITSSSSSQTSSTTNSVDTSIDLTNNTNPYLKGKSYFQEMKNNGLYYTTPSLGERKILVVPVAFKSSSYSSYGSDETIKANLEKTFFSSNNSYWESVASFYKKSSYGNLTFSGEVLDVFTTSKTKKQYLSMDSSDATDSICNEVASYLGEDILKQYDSDNDGVVDCMWLVYLNGYDSSEDLLWAYTYWNENQTQKVEYYIRNYSWASYEFTINSTILARTNVDAHTFIHETGHQLGLDDYYSYDEYKTNRAPVGGLDMMDSNVLDHSSFSKYNLGWVTPSVINSKGTYTLKPFESSGDCLILASNFAGTCFDEYFILEYYTPTGLNQLDSTYRYRSSYPKGFDQSGLKILHVDQRLGRLDINTRTYKTTWDGNYYNTAEFNIPTNLKPYYYEIMNSNSESRSKVNSSWALVELVQASGQTNLMTHYSQSVNNVATNSDLFTTSSNVFGKDVYADYISNEGWKLPYQVEITSSDSSKMTLKITSIN